MTINHNINSIKPRGGGCFSPHIATHPVHTSAGVIKTSHNNQNGVRVLLTTMRCTIKYVTNPNTRRNQNVM